MLDALRQGMKTLQPVNYWSEATFRGEAAVLLAFTDEPETHLILTRRADHLKSHRGEVALPGGKLIKRIAILLQRHCVKAMKKLHCRQRRWKCWANWTRW